MVDVEEHERDDKEKGLPANNLNGDTAEQRCEWAISLIKRQRDDAERLLADLSQALNAVSICLAYGSFCFVVCATDFW